MNENQLISSYVGCTATVCLVTKDHIYCANAGDSRCVLGRTNGPKMCEPLSDDHKPENTDERLRIERAGGMVEENRVNGSLNLSRSIGDFEYKNRKDLDYKQQMVIVDPDIKKVARQANDQFIILACDGIWDCMTSEEGAERIREALAKRKQSEPLTGIVEDMFDNIIADDILTSGGVGTDNMTCIIVEFKK
jgi:serine/threonine protein phosphatase PrpC